MARQRRRGGINKRLSADKRHHNVYRGRQNNVQQFKGMASL